MLWRRAERDTLGGCHAINQTFRRRADRSPVSWPTTTAAQDPSEGGRRFTTELTGEAEAMPPVCPIAATSTGPARRPSPSTRARSGSASTSKSPISSRPTRGHIHRAPAGRNGPIVVTFFEVDSVLLNRLRRRHARARDGNHRESGATSTSTSTMPNSPAAHSADSWPSKPPRAPARAGAPLPPHTRDTAPRPRPYSRA